MNTNLTYYEIQLMFVRFVAANSDGKEACLNMDANTGRAWLTIEGKRANLGQWEKQFNQYLEKWHGMKLTAGIRHLSSL